MKKILALTICLLNTVSAHITIEKDNCKGSEATINEQAAVIAQPLYEQEESRTEINTQIDKKIEELIQKRDKLYDHMTPFTVKKKILAVTLSDLHKNSDKELNNMLVAALNPMCNALKALRAPLEKQVEALTNTYINNEQKYTEDFATLEWSFDNLELPDLSELDDRKDSLTSQIEALYATVDGVLPMVISQSKQSITDFHMQRVKAEDTRLQSQIRQIDNMLNPLIEEKNNLSKQIADLKKQRQNS